MLPIRSEKNSNFSRKKETALLVPDLQSLGFCAGINTNYLALSGALSHGADFKAAANRFIKNAVNAPLSPTLRNLRLALKHISSTMDC